MPDRSLRGSNRRYKVRFREDESFRAARGVEPPRVDIPVVNPRRRLISIVEHGTIDEQLSFYVREFGADVVDDFRYEFEAGPEADAAGSGGPSLDDVLDVVRAPEAWERSRGRGVVIAVVDSGVNGAFAEFPMSKRKGQWSPIGENAWEDDKGHGTMCACIATATRADGGEFDGVAPDAGLISCQTYKYDSEFATIYDYLGDFAAENDVPVVASNSFGNPMGTPPTPDPNSDFVPALDDAIARGVHVVFSAGNYHRKAGGLPERCDPTSIWEFKCRDDVLAVANCRLEGSMWPDSSRGPGQFAGEAGMGDKPDVTAPTPRNGRILTGFGPTVLPAWGSSGACPQVAALAALLLALDPRLDRGALFAAIRNSAVPLGHGATCEGSGRIDCVAALDALPL